MTLSRNLSAHPPRLSRHAASSQKIAEHGHVLRIEKEDRFGIAFAVEHGPAGADVAPDDGVLAVRRLSIRQTPAELRVRMRVEVPVATGDNEFVAFVAGERHTESLSVRFQIEHKLPPGN